MPRRLPTMPRPMPQSIPPAEAPLRAQPRCALVGMPGSGKSTVGYQLARRLRVPLVDLDQKLEETLGMSIRAFFAKHGEAAFREHEARLLADIASQPRPMVLSTGGGIVLREDNREVLRRFGPVFYLRAAPEDIYKRVRHDNKRPLLQVADPLARLRDMHAQRDPLYRETAHYTVETGRPSVHMLVSKIAMQLDMTEA